MRIGILDFIGISFIILGIIISFLVYKLTFGTILLMLLGSAFLVWSLLNYLLGKNRVRYIRRIRKVFLVLFTIWFFSFLLIQGLMLTAVDPQKDAEVDYLLIVGAGLRGEIPSLTLHTRLVTGLDYLKDHPKLKVIVSGGQGPGETITEAEAMKRFLESNGIPEERIIRKINPPVLKKI